MKYKIESIGAAFTAKGITDLSQHLSAQSNEGWELHSVFSVEQKGCLGTSQGTTYLAIYNQKE